MVQTGDITRPDGRTVRWYIDGPEDAHLTLFWQHGTPNIGQPPGPLMKPATDRGMRWVSLDRPGYGGSTRREGRCVADVVEDVAAVADELGLDRFAVVGHSGGGPHALACATELPDRVVACVAIASLAPFDAQGLDWFRGMAPGGRAELEAAALGPAALRVQLESEWDSENFTALDHEAIRGPWKWFNGIVQAALELGPEGMIDDDRAYVTPWRTSLKELRSVPTLVVHGGKDRVVPWAHGQWIAQVVPNAQLRTFPEDGHVSVLLHADAMLDWLVDAAT